MIRFLRLILILLAWHVTFYQDYDTSFWYWRAVQVGWRATHQKVVSEKRFRSKEAAKSDFIIWINSGMDRRWKEK